MGPESSNESQPPFFQRPVPNINTFAQFRFGAPPGRGRSRAGESMKLPIPDMTSLGVTLSKTLLDAPRGGSGQIMGPPEPPRSEQQQRQMRQSSLVPGKNPNVVGVVDNSQRQSQQINNSVTRRIDAGVAPPSALAVRQHQDKQPARSDNGQQLQNTGGGSRKNAQAGHSDNPIVLDGGGVVQPNGADLIAAIDEVRGTDEGNAPLARLGVPSRPFKQSRSAVRYGPPHSNRSHSVHQVTRRRPSASTPVIQTSKEHTPDVLGSGGNVLAGAVARLQAELQGLRERGKFMEGEMSAKTGLLAEERNRTQALEMQIQEDRRANLEVIQSFKNVKQELVDKLVLLQKDLVNRIEGKKDVEAVGLKDCIDKLGQLASISGDMKGQLGAIEVAVAAARKSVDDISTTTQSMGELKQGELALSNSIRVQINNLTKKLDVVEDLRKRANDADLDKRSAESKLRESEGRCEKLSGELALLKLSEKLETCQLQAKLEALEKQPKEDPGHVVTIAVLQHKLEEIAKRADRAEQELTAEKANLRETQVQLDDTMKEVCGARIAHEQAAKRIELFKAEKATYKVQFEDEKQAEMAELEGKAIAFRQKETQKWQSLISALEKQKDALEKKLKDEAARQEKNDLAGDVKIAGLNNKIQELEDSKSHLWAENENTRSELQRLCGILEEKEKTITRFEADLVAGSITANTELENLVKEQKEAILRNKETVRIIDRQLGDARAENECMQALLDEKEDFIRVQSETAGVLEKELATARADKEASHTGRLHDAETWATQLAARTVALALNEATIKELQGKLIQYKCTEEELTKKNLDVANDLMGLQDEMRQERDKSSALSLENERLQTDLLSTQGEVQVLSESLSAAREQANNVQSQLALAGDEKQLLQKRISALEVECTELRKEIGHGSSFSKAAVETITGPLMSPQKPPNTSLHSSPPHIGPQDPPANPVTDEDSVLGAQEYPFSGGLFADSGSTVVEAGEASLRDLQEILAAVDVTSTTVEGNDSSDLSPVPDEFLLQQDPGQKSVSSEINPPTSTKTIQTEASKNHGQNLATPPKQGAQSRAPKVGRDKKRKRPTEDSSSKHQDVNEPKIKRMTRQSRGHSQKPRNTSSQGSDSRRRITITVESSSPTKDGPPNPQMQNQLDNSYVQEASSFFVSSSQAQRRGIATDGKGRATKRGSRKGQRK